MNAHPDVQPRADCPSRELLSAIAVGRLCGTVRDAVEHHIEGCDSCLAVLQSINDESDPLIADLRGPVAPESDHDVHEDRTWAERFGNQDGPFGRSSEPKFGRSGDGRMPERLGDYRLMEPLGRGGMGTVYRAHHSRLDRVVALKVLRPERASDHRAIARFRLEMSNLGGLDHPNLVRALDAREEAGIAFLVMEYLEGLDLARLLERNGPLPIADACEVVRQAAIGLEHAYRTLGLIHRDIKPANLMITPAGCVKVLDLGIARLAPIDPEAPGRARAALTDVDEHVGTRDYMAPEQWLTGRGADIRADVYGMGCTLYELLTGRAPFAGERWMTREEKMMAHALVPPPPIREQRSDVPDGLSAVLDRMLAKRPAERYATPADVARALIPFTAGHDLPSDMSVPTISLNPEPANIDPAGNGVGVARSERGWGRQRRNWSRLPRFSKPVTAVVTFVALLLLSYTIAGRWQGREPKSVSVQGESKEAKTAPPASIARNGDLVKATLTVHLWRFGKTLDDLTPLGRIGDPPDGPPQAPAHVGLYYDAEATFDEPLFPYLIVIDPDGTPEPKYPEKGSNALAGSQFQYPSGDFYLEIEREGLVGVVLLGSRKTLSSAEVLNMVRVDKEAWSQIKTPFPWWYHGKRCDPLVTHREGTPGKVSHGLKPLTELGMSLSSQPGIAAVRIVAFPVKPAPKEP